MTAQENAAAPIFRIGLVGEAQRLILRNHYAHRVPSIIVFCATQHEPGGLFGDMGETIAAITFSIPPRQYSEPVLELTRLVRKERRIPLTPLISFACAEIRRRALCDLLVSYADWAEYHHGGIYQAASWNYDGFRKPAMVGVIINNAKIHGRSASTRFGTRSPSKLRNLLGDSDVVEPDFDSGKHMYWRALNKRGEKQAGRMGFQKLPYPKPDKPHTGSK